MTPAEPPVQRRPRPRSSYALPTVLWICTAIGLLSALLGDGVWNGLSWLTLALPPLGAATVAEARECAAGPVVAMMQPSVAGVRTRLLPDWHSLLESMAALGRMQLWVGNGAAALVRQVHWADVQVRESCIDFIADGVHARLDLPHCGAVFASETARASSMPLVLGVHDRAGDVAMEFRFPSRVRQGFETLVRAYHCPLEFGAPRQPVGTTDSRANDEIDVQAMRAEWDCLGEDRSMHALLERFGTTFAQCCRLAGNSRARRVSAAMAHARLLAAEEQRVPTILRIHNRAASAAHIGCLCATRSVGSMVHLYACCGFGASITLPSLATGWELARPGLEAPSRSIEFVDGDDARVLSIAFPRRSHLDYL